MFIVLNVMMSVMADVAAADNMHPAWASQVDDKIPA